MNPVVDCLGSLLIFLGFWRLGKVAKMVNWILSLAPADILGVSRVGECGGEGMVEREGGTSHGLTLDPC